MNESGSREPGAKTEPAAAQADPLAQLRASDRVLRQLVRHLTRAKPVSDDGLEHFVRRARRELRLNQAFVDESSKEDD